MLADVIRALMRFAVHVTLVASILKPRYTSVFEEVYVEEPLTIFDVAQEAPVLYSPTRPCFVCLPPTRSTPIDLKPEQGPFSPTYAVVLIACAAILFGVLVKAVASRFSRGAQAYRATREASGVVEHRGALTTLNFAIFVRVITTAFFASLVATLSPTLPSRSDAFVLALAKDEYGVPAWRSATGEFWRQIHDDPEVEPTKLRSLDSSTLVTRDGYKPRKLCSANTSRSTHTRHLWPSHGKPFSQREFADHTTPDQTSSLGDGQTEYFTALDSENDSADTFVTGRTRFSNEVSVRIDIEDTETHNSSAENGTSGSGRSFLQDLSQRLANLSTELDDLQAYSSFAFAAGSSVVGNVSALVSFALSSSNSVSSAPGASASASSYAIGLTRSSGERSVREGVSDGSNGNGSAQRSALSEGPSYNDLSSRMALPPPPPLSDYSTMSVSLDLPANVGPARRLPPPSDHSTQSFSTDYASYGSISSGPSLPPLPPYDSSSVSVSDELSAREVADSWRPRRFAPPPRPLTPPPVESTSSVDAAWDGILALPREAVSQSFTEYDESTSGSVVLGPVPAIVIEGPSTSAVLTPAHESVPDDASDRRSSADREEAISASDSGLSGYSAFADGADERMAAAENVRAELGISTSIALSSTSVGSDLYQEDSSLGANDVPARAQSDSENMRLLDTSDGSFAGASDSDSSRSLFNNSSFGATRGLALAQVDPDNSSIMGFSLPGSEISSSW